MSACATCGHDECRHYHIGGIVGQRCFAVGCGCHRFVAVGGETAAPSEPIAPSVDRAVSSAVAASGIEQGSLDAAVGAESRASTEEGMQRVTHGRHCRCTACATEDWLRITGHCGMHGKECPAVYEPLGNPGDLVVARTAVPSPVSGREGGVR